MRTYLVESPETQILMEAENYQELLTSLRSMAYPPMFTEIFEKVTQYQLIYKKETK